MIRDGMWTDAELAIVREVYPVSGTAGVHALLPHRTTSAIGFKAWSLQLRRSATKSNSWTPDEIALLRDAYRSGNGMRDAAIALPHRATSAISTQASKLGLTRKRAASTSAAPKLKPIVKPRPMKPGPCDRFDREFIRRRLPHIVVDLSGELQRTPVAIFDALVEMARTRFAPDALARINVDRNDAYARSSEGAA